MTTPLLTTLFVVASMSSCSIAFASHEGETSAPKAGIVDYQLSSVQFLSGHPLPGESFEVSAKTPSATQIHLLEVNATFIKELPAEVGVEIAGSADDRECVGSECYDLSLRRATCVYDWVIANGVSASKLRGPRGYGTDYPIDDRDSEAGRQYNRRVQFDFVSTK